MKGFILAAGFGQRLLPVTGVVPKPLLPIGNLPLIRYAIELLKHHGITELIINLHHLGKAIEEALGDGEAFGVQITYSEEEEEILGTGGGLKRMHEQLADDTFVVVNSDAIIDVDLTAVIAQHKANKALATMVLREDPHKEEFGQIEIDETGRIRRILGQGPGNEGSLRGLMFTGVHVIEPRFLEYIPPDVATCIIRYAYAKALSNDERLFGYVNEGYFADAGTPARYYRTNADALEQRMPLRHADPLSGFELSPRHQVAEVVRMGRDVELGNGVNLVPPVLLGDGVRLGEGATVGPYAILQPGVHVGREAQVSHSVVLEGCKVEAGAQLTHALVAKKASLELVDDRE